MSKAKPGKKTTPPKGPTTEAPSALIMMNALPDPVLVFNPTFNICFSNQAAQAFFRLSDKRLSEKDMSELLGKENVIFETAEMIVRKNISITLHDVSIKGKPIASVAITTIEPDIWYLMVIHQQSIQLANEWNETTKYSLKSTQMVAQMLAHEIKNPLAGIRGAAQLLDKSALSTEDRELAHLIAHETGRIQTLVEKFNIFNEVPPEQYKPVNLHQVLNHAAKVAQAEYGAGIEIEEKFDPSLPDIRGHFDHLVQAQMNLIKNAAEALPDKKGKISIRTYYDAQPAYHPERNEKLPLCIEIEDNGRGISSDVMNRIFQPYFTTKSSGQGLGLPIVSKIVDDHGGTIDVTSEPGKTVFKLSFPLVLDFLNATGAKKDGLQESEIKMDEIKMDNIKFDSIKLDNFKK